MFCVTSPAMTIDELKNEKVGICVSGGLDSRTIARKLVDAGVELCCFTADLAQPDEADINDVKEKMAPCGAETVVVDLRNAMAEACLEIVRAQATYDGGYWNTTGIARAVTVQGIIPAMQASGCTVLAHGATGRGNDQVRFERYTNVLAPAMKVYAPWRDPVLLAQFPGRSQMAEYLNGQGISAFPGGEKKYSTDANLAGLSHEAEDLESLDTPCTIVTPTMGVWPQDAPDDVEICTVKFEGGRAVELNGKALSPLEIMLEANRIGGRNGIGMKHALENRVIGTKSRGVYEAPGMELLGNSLMFVYQATIDRRSWRLFEHLSTLVADQVYDGRYFEPATTAALLGIEELSRRATGIVTIGLYRGNVQYQRLADCPHSLYSEADASMEASDGLNPVSSQGFVEVQSVEARIMAQRGHIRR